MAGPPRPLLVLGERSPLLDQARVLVEQADGPSGAVLQVTDGSTRALPPTRPTDQVVIGTSAPAFFARDLLLRCEDGRCGDVRLLVDGPLPAVERLGWRARPWLRSIHLAVGQELPSPLPAPLSREVDLARLLADPTSPPVLYEEVPSRLPRRLQIQTTTACRARCPTCPHDGTGEQRMDEGLFTAVLEQCLPGEVDWIELYLHAEPQQDPRLPALASVARRTCPGVLLSIVTHEAMVDRPRAEALADSGLDVVFVSVNAHHERAGSAGVDDLRRRLERLAAPAAVLQGVGKRLVVTTLRELLRPGMKGPFRRACRELGLPYESFTLTSRGGDVDGARLAPRERRARSAPCTRPFVQAYLRWSGELITCCEDWRYQRMLGDLAVQSLAEAWNGPAYRSLRRELLDRAPAEPCARCELAKTR